MKEKPDIGLLIAFHLSRVILFTLLAGLVLIVAYQIYERYQTGHYTIIPLYAILDIFRIDWPEMPSFQGQYIIDWVLTSPMSGVLFVVIFFAYGWYVGLKEEYSQS